MEIQLKVPLVEKHYSALAIILIIIRIPLFLAFGFFWVDPATKPVSIFLFIAFMTATIGNTYIKKYKEIGEIILGYHSVTIDGQVFLIRDMQEFFIRIETERRKIRTPLPTFLSGANNYVVFSINNSEHTYRLLLNEKDIEAVDFLSKQWNSLYNKETGKLKFY